MRNALIVLCLVAADFAGGYVVRWQTTDPEQKLVTRTVTQTQTTATLEPGADTEAEATGGEIVAVRVKHGRSNHNAAVNVTVECSRGGGNIGCDLENGSASVRLFGELNGEDDHLIGKATITSTSVLDAEVHVPLHIKARRELIRKRLIRSVYAKVKNGEELKESQRGTITKVPCDEVYAEDVKVVNKKYDDCGLHWDGDLDPYYGSN